MPLIREYASAAKPAPGSWVMVIDLIGDFSSQAKVGSAKSPGTPKLCLTPRRCRYSKRNCPSGIRAGNGRTSEADRPRACRPLLLCLVVEVLIFRFMTLLCRLTVRHRVR